MIARVVGTVSYPFATLLIFSFSSGQACTLVGSVETLLAGGAALSEKSDVEEAIKRVKKAQALIAKFIEESGVTDEKLSAYVASHK